MFSCGAQSITLTDVSLKMFGEVILKEVVERLVFPTAEAPVLPVVPGRHLIQRSFDSAKSHLATFVVFASMLTVRALELVSVLCPGEESK